MPWFRWFFRYQAALVKSFERHVAQTVDLIAPVSEDDAAKFRSLAPGVRYSRVAPIGMDFLDEAALPVIKNSSMFELLSIGRLDWLPNREGLQWFLEKVWPPLVQARPDIALTIAGKTGDGRWLEKFKTSLAFDVLGRWQNIAPLYESCALAIAPLFQGSGTRVSRLLRPPAMGEPS